jgi:hypothetical protein
LHLGLTILPDKLKIIRVFIGSPGGLDEERRAAHEIVASVNRSHSERWGLLFKLLGWENAVPGYVRPQAKINEDLDRCDYFIGVLWDRWGSRPSTDPNGFTSGFEEEFVRAEQRINATLMKDMALFFKEVDVPRGMEPGDDLKKVLLFRRKCVDEKKVFFKPFTDIVSFRDFIREKLEEIGWRETDMLSDIDETSNQSSEGSPSVEGVDASTSVRPKLLSQESRDFLIALTERPSGWNDTTAQEVARLRLIGSAFKRGGNDNDHLGNHDANLIFNFYRDKPLSGEELQALTDCGVSGFQHQNVPLWRWMARTSDSQPWERIELLTLVGSDAERKNAIDLLDLGSRPIPIMETLVTRREVLESWLSDDRPGQVFEAATGFLGTNAAANDVPLIEEISANCAADRRAKIETAIVTIISRNDPDAALRRIVERQVDKISGDLGDILFGNPRSLRTPTLNACLSAKSEIVRLRAAQVLSARGEIALETARTLMTDTSHEIRLIAAESFRKGGQTLDEAVVKAALRIVKQSSPLAGLFKQRETDDRYYDQYRKSMLAELSFDKLIDAVESAGIFDELELGVFYSKFASRMAAEVRACLSDCFKSRFTQKLDRQLRAGKIDEAFVDRVKKLETLMRTELSNQALNVLCSLNKPSDIELVRKVLQSVEIGATEQVLTYLSRFGAWSDIEPIKKLGDYPTGAVGLLDFARTKLPDKKAAAILSLGKARFADVLALDLDFSIRSALIKQLPKAAFAELSDDALLSELGQKDDVYRRIVALRCVQALPKARVLALLNHYVNAEGHRFYNVIHWLDLGATFPSQEAKSIAGRAITRI